MRYESAFTKEELTARWDVITSPGRFAGANETLDWVYNASRKGDRVKLVKKPRAAYDPYATVFRGKIESRGGASRIRGVFTKSVFDYVITAVISAVYFGVCAEYLSRAHDRTVPLILISVGIAAVIFALTPMPGKIRKYGALIREVTGPSPRAKKKEAEDIPASQPAQSDGPRKKYDFRVFGRKK